MNKAFIRKLARRLRRLRHEEHYDQSTWGTRTSCGTAACLAGHAVLMAGYKFAMGPEDGDAWDCEKRGEIADIRETANGLLGVENLSFDLFSPIPHDAWPGAFARRWRAARPRSKDTSKRPTRIAADLLDAIAAGKIK